MSYFSFEYGIGFEEILCHDISNGYKTRNPVLGSEKSPWPGRKSAEKSLAMLNLNLVMVTQGDVRGCIQNIPDWCRHLYSSCGSAKHR
jgi:hypothetical protein